MFQITGSSFCFSDEMDLSSFYLFLTDDINHQIKQLQLQFMKKMLP